jgi:hypothetical protein
MRKTTAFLLLGMVLASGGFAATAIGSHGGLLGLLTGTTGTTTMTSTTPGQRWVTLCHRTGSRKHHQHTITVAEPAVAAHLRHGDTLGPCAPAPGQTTQTTATSGTTTESDSDGDTSGEHGQGHDNGSGNKHDDGSGANSAQGHDDD